jgi:hypothetical protein
MQLFRLVKSYVARRKIAALPTKLLRDYHAARESLRDSSENLLALEEALAGHISGWSRADTLTLVDAEPPVHSPFDLSTDKFAYVDLIVRSHGAPLNNRVTVPLPFCLSTACPQPVHPSTVYRLFTFTACSL